MSDRILPRYIGAAPQSRVQALAATEVEATDDLGAFGWLRGVGDRAIMLELRKKDGCILALSYLSLDMIEFDPSAGITFNAAGQTITITGRNLNGEVTPHVRLFHGIIRHRVPWVQEANRASRYQAETSATVVEKIDW